MENHHAIKTIRERRSTRRFQNKKISFDKIALLVEAGSKAPSAGNLQDYRFIVIEDKEKINVLAEHCNEQHWIATAPTLIIVCSDTARTEAYYGLRGQRLYSAQGSAAATQNILLTAQALGLGACWIGSFNEEFIADEFGIPDKVRPQSIIALGYSEGQPDPKTEEDLETLVYFNKYGNKIKNLNIVLREYSKEIDKYVTQQEKQINKNVKTLTHKFKEFVKQNKNRFTQKEQEKNKIKEKYEEENKDKNDEHREERNQD